MPNFATLILLFYTFIWMALKLIDSNQLLAMLKSHVSYPIIDNSLNPSHVAPSRLSPPPQKSPQTGILLSAKSSLHNKMR